MSVHSGRVKMMRHLPVGKIRLDFQPAENLIEETVQTYVYQLRSGGRFQPLRARFDGTNYFLEDGFHRLEAAKRMGRKRVEVQIRPGTLAQMETKWRNGMQRFLARLREEKESVPNR
jgi:hypothetical protein